MANEKIIFDTEVKVGSSVGSVKSLKAELRAVTNELGTLEQGSEAFIKAAQKAGELKDRIGDIKATVNAFNPEAKFQALAGAVGIAANGFSAMQGAMALMGSENEDLNKTIAQTQGAIALATGLNGLLGMKDAFILLKTTSIATFASIKASIMATGLGGLIIALAAVATAFYAMATASEASAKRQIAAINDTQDKLNEQYDLEIAIAKAQGKNTEELERGKIEDKLTSARKQIRISQEQLDKQLWINDEEQKAHDELVKNKKSIDSEYLIFEAGATKARLDRESKYYEDKKTKDKDENEKAKSEKKRIDDYNKEQEQLKLKVEEGNRESDRAIEDVIAFNKEEDRKKKEEDDKKDLDRRRALAAQQVQVKQEQAAAEKEIDEASIEAKRQLFQTTSQILGGLADLAGKQTEEGKVLAIAQATIDTYLSASSAYAAAAKIDPIVLAPLAAGAAILAGFARVKAIADIKVPNGGGGGGGGVAPTAPRIPQSITGTRLGGNSQVTTTGDSTVGKVIVVETDITNTQDKVKNIIRKATIK
jgi:hypothetical protein